MKLSFQYFLPLFLVFSFCSSPSVNTEIVKEPVEVTFHDVTFEVRVEDGYTWEYGYTFIPKESRMRDDELPSKLLEDFDILIGTDGEFAIWDIDTSGLSSFLGIEEPASSQWSIITISNEPLTEDEVQIGTLPYIDSESAGAYFLIKDIQWGEEIETSVETVVDEEVEVLVEEQVVENFITINSPEDGDAFHYEPIVISGDISSNVEKIVVTAYYPDSMDRSNTLKDVYTLQEFQPGDTSFTYRAKVSWNNLGPGLNSYTFVAYFTDGSEETATVNVWFEYLLPSDQ